MSEANLSQYKRGRTAYPVRANQWPVVTQAIMTRAVETGEIDEAKENPLVGALVRGHVHLHTCMVWLKKAMQEARKKEDAVLAHRINVELERLQQVKEEWPLEVVE